MTGVKKMHGVEYEIIPDRIQTGTLLIGGAITRGDVTVTRCRPSDLAVLMLKLQECGVNVTTGDDWIRIQADAVKSGTDIVTAPHPGFPTDLQPQMLTFLCTRRERACRRVDLQRAFLVRQRTLTYGRRRARGDGQQHRARQRRAARSPVRRLKRPTFVPARRS